MKFNIPAYINAIKPYEPGRPIEAIEREYGIKNSVKLASNENPLGPSPMALDAVKAHLSTMNRYPDGSGHVLTRRLAEEFAVAPENVVIGNGSDDIIALMAQGFLNRGDEALMPLPSFLMYEISVRAVGAVPVMMPLNGFDIDLSALLEGITDRTAMIFLTNPNNPTGSHLTFSEVTSFLEKVPENILVIVDEAYIEFARDPQVYNALATPLSDPRVVCLRTFSKAYGLAGFRVGYGIMPQEVAGILHRVRQPFNVNALAQVAARAALDDHEFLKKSVYTMHRGIDFLRAGLSDLGFETRPTQANFFLVDVRVDAGRVFEKMLKKGVIVRSMKSYGFDTYLRISAGLDAENRRFLSVLEELMVQGEVGFVKKRIITIDGPAGAGKTTVSRALARKLGWVYVDTGALYRGVALAVKCSDIDWEDDIRLEPFLKTLDLGFAMAGKEPVLMCNGEDISGRIRTPEIAMLASKVSARPCVRRALLDIQHAVARAHDAVFEGRDMGTVVFPRADHKFFLFADLETRAHRRFKEAPEQGENIARVREMMASRDARDAGRETAPLKPASDAIMVDSTHLTLEEVVAQIFSVVTQGR